MSLIRAYREDYFSKINSRTCTVIRDIRVRFHNIDVICKSYEGSPFGNIERSLNFIDHYKKSSLALVLDKNCQCILTENTASFWSSVFESQMQLSAWSIKSIVPKKMFIPFTVLFFWTQFESLVRLKQTQCKKNASQLKNFLVLKLPPFFLHCVWVTEKGGNFKIKKFFNRIASFLYWLYFNTL